MPPAMPDYFAEGSGNNSDEENEENKSINVNTEYMVRSTLANTNQKHQGAFHLPPHLSVESKMSNR